VFANIMIERTACGASSDVIREREPEPMWIHTTVPVSPLAWKKDPHSEVWMLGRPSRGLFGFGIATC
jgi:hypothetical protein